MLYLNTTKDAEDENQKKKIGLMAMGPEKGREPSSPSSSSSKPLHNFNLPFGLRWGNQKFLRCMKVSSNGEISAVQRRSSSISSVSAAVNASNGNHNHNLNASSSADFVSMIGKRKEREANFRRGSDFKRLSSNFKPPPPPLPPSWSTAAESGDDDGIASVREKLLFDLQTAADKMKDSILREGLETEEQDNNPTSSATANVAATVAPAASKTAEPAARPWFLRSRRAAFKASTQNGFSSSGAETSNGGAGDSSPSRSLKVAENNKSSPRLRSGGATATASPTCEKKERAKFSVSLMRQEIEEDFLATAGRRPPRRPQKRSKYVQNKLDIIKRANELGEDPISLSGRFCEEFLKDMDDLQCLPPTHQPRVSDHIEEIKQMISQIINNGCAYTVDGDVYFSIDNFPNYGRLSGQNLEGNRAGERVAVDSRKRNPADFALWKAAKPGEPSWDSPWGPGRPGWHIECSAMSAHYLTHSFDIHGGGMDLIFPHHENEIAQSCAACSESNVSYWVHNGFVTVDDEKMSKSLGNFFTIREVTKLYHPLALRHFLLGMHYRSPVNYSISQLEIASDAVFYIYQTLKDGEDALVEFQEKNETNELKASISQEAGKCIKKLHNEILTKMSDDLHTSTIVNAALLEALRLINSSIETLKKKLQKKQQLSAVQSLTELVREVRAALDVLGLLPNLTYSEVLLQLKEKALKRARLTEDDILSSIEERAQARKNKDYAKSDQIRSALAVKGIALMDVGKETVWRPCVPIQQENPVVPVQQEHAGAPPEQVQPCVSTNK